MNKKVDIFLFGILSIFLGAFVGAVTWLFLAGVHIVTEFIWTDIPSYFGFDEVTIIGTDSCGMLIYDIGICLIGGLIIGLWIKKTNVELESLEEVMAKVKKDGGYNYNKVHIMFVSAFLPLIFGGAIGPEAGLTGVIAGLCTFVGDRLKYKGDKLKNMAGAGFAATLGVIFNAPLYGITEQIERRMSGEIRERERLVSKVTRTIIYALAVAGGVCAFKLLSHFVYELEGLPRFSSDRIGDFTAILSQWMWIVPLIIIGIIVAIIYAVFNKLFVRIGEALKKYKMVSCLIAGLILGIVGHFIGSGRFSGEGQLYDLMDTYQGVALWGLVVLGVVKLLMVNLSVNLGWKGGTIFPMIYSASAVGFACAVFIQTVAGVDSFESTFAVAIVVAAMLGFLMRKPVTVIAILLLCFPLSFLPVMIVTAILSSLAGKYIFKAIGGKKQQSEAVDEV